MQRNIKYAESVYDPKRVAMPVTPKTRPKIDAKKVALIPKPSTMTAATKPSENAIATNGNNNINSDGSKKRPHPPDGTLKKKPSPLVDYDSSSMSSNSSGSFNTKQRDSDGNRQKIRSTLAAPESQKKLSSPPSNRIKQQDSNRAADKTVEAKTKENRLKYDGAKPSTSKHHSRDSDQGGEHEKVRSIRKAVRALNRALDQSDVRKLTDEFVQKIKNHLKNGKKAERHSQSTQTDELSEAPSISSSSSEVSESAIIKNKPKEKPKAKRYSDDESLQVSRELEDLIDPDSFHYVPGPLSKRRRKSVLPNLCETDSPESSEMAPIQSNLSDRPSSSLSATSTGKRIWYEDGE